MLAQPLAKVELLPGKYEKLVPIITFFDTGATASIINPATLPRSYWLAIMFQTFHSSQWTKIRQKEMWTQGDRNLKGEGGLYSNVSLKFFLFYLKLFLLANLCVPYTYYFIHVVVTFVCVLGACKT